MLKSIGSAAVKALLLYTLLNGRGWSQTTAADTVRAIIASFDRVNLVGLGERHGNLADSQFRLKLVRAPEFSDKVNDIVIEFGNPLYQTVLDKFVAGDSVPHDELKRVWQQTTQRGSGVWNSPVYEEFIAAVRSVNLGLPSIRRLRVVAGDYPIDWGALPASGSRIDRDASAATVIRREVLDKNRKALVIFGLFHLFRHRPGFQPPVVQPNGTLVSLLEGDARAKWFLVAPVSGSDLPAVITANRAEPDKPVLVMANKAVGALDATVLGWEVKPNRLTVGQLVDAFLYFGRAPSGTIHRR